MKKSSILVFAFFNALFVMISFLNHYHFRTNTLDLGFYTNTLYQYAHGIAPSTASINQVSNPILADHFDLYLPVFSPLVYIFGTYTLLFIQIIFINIAAIGTIKLAKKYYDSVNPNLAVIILFTFFGVYSALEFEYHSNVVSACLIPWLFYHLRNRKNLNALLLTTAMLFGKENTGIFLFFIFTGLLAHKEFRRQKPILLLLALFSLTYSTLIVGWVMPSLTDSNHYHAFSYNTLGDSPSSALKTIMLHPIDTIKVLFTNHNLNPEGNYVKLEFWVFIIVSSFFLLARPLYLFMFIPLLAQKLLHDNPMMWSIFYHYNFEFGMIITIGFLDVCHSFISNKNKLRFTYLVIVLNLILVIRMMDNSVAYFNKDNLRPYSAEHYTDKYERTKISRIESLVPGDAVISVQNQLFSHFCLRSQIYQFPLIKSSEYIILDKSIGSYPISANDFNKKYDSLQASPDWEVILSETDWIILKKK